MNRTRITIILGAMALSLAAAPSALARPLTATAAKRAAVSRAAKDARRDGTVLGVSAAACRRAGARSRVCRVTTRVSAPAGEQICRARYRVTLHGGKARARRTGARTCAVAPGSSSAPAGSAPAPGSSGSAPAPAPATGAAPPAGNVDQPPAADGAAPDQGDDYDPFGECWGGC